MESLLGGTLLGAGLRGLWGFLDMCLFDRSLFGDLLRLFFGFFGGLLGLGYFSGLRFRSFHSLGLDSFRLASLYRLSRRSYRGG